jgi:hypothetical protein
MFYLPDDKCQKQTIDYQENQSSWHQEHGTRIKLPSSPVLGITASEIGILAISDRVNLSESLCSTPGELNGHYAYNCLHHQVDTNSLHTLLHKATRSS